MSLVLLSAISSTWSFIVAFYKGLLGIPALRKSFLPLLLTSQQEASEFHFEGSLEVEIGGKYGFE